MAQGVLGEGTPEGCRTPHNRSGREKGPGRAGTGRDSGSIAMQHPPTPPPDPPTLTLFLGGRLMSDGFLWSTDGVSRSAIRPDNFPPLFPRPPKQGAPRQEVQPD